MRDKILTFLKSRKDYSSGQKIADELHITRNAVNKHIKALRVMGYTIVSKKASGYRLLDDLNFIDDASLERNFKKKLLGREIFHFKSISSTNDEAYRLAENGMSEGTVIISDRQTRGKGRMGSKWESSSAYNLYFSVILRPKMLPSAAPKIILISAIAVSEAIAAVAHVETKIKWPNDIFVGGKKVCGILTEMKSESDIIDFIVVGIGVNVNSTKRDFPEEIQKNATTLFEETKEITSRQALLEKIISNLEKWYIILKKEDFEPIKSEWAEHCFLMGRTVTVKTIDEEVTGRVLGIDDNCFLVIDTGSATRKIFSGTIKKVL